MIELTFAQWDLADLNLCLAPTPGDQVEWD